MPTASGKALHAPFRIFFALAACTALCAQEALAQPVPKPGPMQSGRHASEAAAAQAQPFDVPKLFATTCGWCHFGGGRQPGKGPQLMGTQLTDEQIIGRIRNGKVGAMPSFKGAFTDEQVQAIVSYIRDLKPLASGEVNK
jgi:mono/diheme cytochrome c family protein